jgi:hypothetical protein
MEGWTWKVILPFGSAAQIKAEMGLDLIQPLGNQPAAQPTTGRAIELEHASPGAAAGVTVSTAKQAAVIGGR